MYDMLKKIVAYYTRKHKNKKKSIFDYDLELLSIFENKILNLQKSHHTFKNSHFFKNHKKKSHIFEQL